MFYYDFSTTPLYPLLRVEVYLSFPHLPSVFLHTRSYSCSLTLVHSLVNPLTIRQAHQPRVPYTRTSTLPFVLLEHTVLLQSEIILTLPLSNFLKFSLLTVLV